MLVVETVSRNVDGKASNRRIPVFHGSHPRLAVGVGGAVLGGQQRPRFWALLQNLARGTKKNVRKKTQRGVRYTTLSPNEIISWVRGSRVFVLTANVPT